MFIKRPTKYRKHRQKLNVERASAHEKKKKKK